MHRIEVDQARSVKQFTSLAMKGVEIEFVDQSGESHRIQLALRKQKDFLKLVPLRSESAEHSLLRPAMAAGEPEEVLLRSAGTGELAPAGTLLRPEFKGQEQIPRNDGSE